MKNKSAIKRLLTVVLMLLFIGIITGKANAQHIDENLWGSWQIETIAITIDGVSKTYSIEELLTDKNRLPRNMFTSLYFHENGIGVNNTETEFDSDDNMVSLKGTFTAGNGEMVVTMYGEQSRTFSYTIENNLLKIHYAQANRQFDLTYKKEEW